MLDEDQDVPQREVGLALAARQQVMLLGAPEGGGGGRRRGSRRCVIAVGCGRKKTIKFRDEEKTTAKKNPKR